MNCLPLIIQPNPNACFYTVHIFAGKLTVDKINKNLNFYSHLLTISSITIFAETIFFEQH